MNIRKPESRVNRETIDIKEFIKSQQERTLYKIALEHHRKTEGYGLYVNYSMLSNYIDSKGLKIESDSHINEYASMLIQKALDDSSIKEVTPEAIESSLKQAICFEALKNISGNRELTLESVNILHSKAEILSEKLNDENIRVLNDKKLMKEANAVISIDSSVPSLLLERSEQIITSNTQFVEDKQQDISDTLSIGKDKSRGLEI